MSEEKKEESFSDLARRSDPAILIEVLEQESVFVASIVISSLEPCHASLVLKSLKEPLRTQVAVEITKGMKVSNSVLEAVLKDVSIKVQALAQGGLKSLGGRDFMVDVLNEMDAERERQILEGISAKSSELAEQLKKCIFTFDDIVLLDDEAVQKLLGELDISLIAKALKDYEKSAAAKKLTANMPKMALAMLKENIEIMHPIRAKDRDEAQQMIIAVIRRLEDHGEIVIHNGE